MNKAIPYVFSVILLTASIFSGCKSTRTATDLAGKQVSRKKADLSEKERITLDRLFFTANKEKMLGNMDIAANLFNQCLKMDPDNDAALYEVAMIYNNQGQYEDALPLIKKAAALKQENIWYKKLLAKVYQNNRLYDDAIKIYEDLTARYPERTDYFFDLASAYLYGGKLEEAIAVYDDLEKKYGVNEELVIQKERLYLRMDKTQEAINEVKKLIEHNPGEARYYGMLAELYFANEMDEEALATFRQLEEMDPDNPLIHFSLADYYRSIGEKEKSYEELKKAFAQPNADIDTKVRILLSFYSITETNDELITEALELCNILVQTHPAEAKSFAMHGDFLYREKQLEKARDAYRKAIALDSEKYAVWSQLLLIESELEDYKALEEESSRALELFPSQPFLYLLNGIGNIQVKDYEEAVKVLKQGVDLAVDNSALRAQFYSNMGDAYHNLQKHASSDQAYEKALKLEPKNTYVLNNYSYYLSLRGDSLDKAAEMSRRSNELTPDNASFQDTYGWVLFKLGRYREAEQWLKKAMDTSGNNNSTILEHYGDVLFKLGKVEEALEYWDRARAAGKVSDLLDRKIADRMFYEQ